MDGLAGYGSDSDSSQEAKQPTRALVGLLGDYSDDDSHHGGTTSAAASEPPSKRSKHNENAGSDVVVEEKIPDILPPPKLNGDITSRDHFQSVTSKDYTVQLREKLSNQLKSLMKEPQSEKHQQLSKKLEQMYQTFHSSDTIPNNDSEEIKSFASHLKSQHQFHNPHLSKDIISHFEISPLSSHVGNTFSGFEYINRLMGAEERSRVAAAAANGDA